MRKIAGASALRRFFVCENVVESPVPFGEFVRKLQNMAEIAEKLFKCSTDYDILLSRSSFGAERGRKHEKTAIFRRFVQIIAFSKHFWYFVSNFQIH